MQETVIIKKKKPLVINLFGAPGAGKSTGAARVKPYNPKGRNQSEEESDALADETKKLLETNCIDYKIVCGNNK